MNYRLSPEARSRGVAIREVLEEVGEGNVFVPDYKKGRRNPLRSSKGMPLETLPGVHRLQATINDIETLKVHRATYAEKLGQLSLPAIDSSVRSTHNPVFDERHVEGSMAYDKPLSPEEMLLARKEYLEKAVASEEERMERDAAESSETQAS